MLSNGITESILSSIHKIGEAEGSSYDYEYLSDDEPLVQGFIGICVVPEGSSIPEQLVLQAVAQGVFLQRARYSDELSQSKGSSSTKQAILATLGLGKSKTWRRKGLGPVVLMAGESRRKDELLTNLGEDNEDDFT